MVVSKICMGRMMLVVALEMPLLILEISVKMDLMVSKCTCIEVIGAFLKGTNIIHYTTSAL